jgi:predicted Rossmann fold flavoprotein
MKIAIIGGGASGLCCAIAAARKSVGKDVGITVYESKDRVGKKILATGNGRCNMFNAYAKAEDYSSPDFVRDILSLYDADAVRLFFESLGLYTRTDEEGRAYPLSNQAASVLDVLRNECEHLKIKILCDSEITSVRKQGKGFLLSDGKIYDKVVLSCGGKAVAKNFGGYELLKSMGHTVTKLMPALTKLTVRDNTYTRQLKGIRHKANLRLYIDGKKITEEDGELLFADYGLSGIAVMQLSSLVARHFRVSKTLPVVECDFVPSMSFGRLCEAAEKICRYNKEMKAENLLTGFMPKKLGEAVLKSVGVPINTALSQLSGKDIKNIASACKDFRFEISGLRPFDDAQVTSGGVDVREFDSRTLESKKVKNLYCCGELLDVDGPCGGYNLLWAFAGGLAVGESLIN